SGTELGPIPVRSTSCPCLPVPTASGDKSGLSDAVESLVVAPGLRKTVFHFFARRFRRDPGWEQVLGQIAYQNKNLERVPTRLNRSVIVVAGLACARA
ncbi:MAG: hypothetical protein ACLFU3_02280, partial [Dichotomicrobium sp.]